MVSGGWLIPSAIPMQIGICTSLETAAKLPSDGFEFFELNVQSFLVPEKDEAAFAHNLLLAAALPRPVKAANCFLPATLPCVGPAVDSSRLLRYVEAAFRRAERAGIDTIVFGSGAARTLPASFERSEAAAQFGELLRTLGPLASAHGVTLAVEPLHRAESNFINSLAEGAEVVRLADHPNVRLLADTYHMGMEKEPLSELIRHGSLLAHVHTAELFKRGCPGKSGEDFSALLRTLTRVGYGGALSIECVWEDILSEIGPSLRFLRGEIERGASLPEAHF